MAGAGQAGERSISRRGPLNWNTSVDALHRDDLKVRAKFLPSGTQVAEAVTKGDADNNVFKRTILAACAREALDCRTLGLATEPVVNFPLAQFPQTPVACEVSQHVFAPGVAALSRGIRLVMTASGLSSPQARTCPNALANFRLCYEQSPAETCVFRKINSSATVRSWGMIHDPL